MRFAVTLLGFFLSLYAFSQDTLKYFQFEKGEVFFQHVYEYQDSLLEETLYAHCSTLASSELTSSKNSIITSKINLLDIDYTERGLPWSKRPIYLNASTISGNVVIEIKENRYRVTVSKITYVSKTPNALFTTMELKEVVGNSKVIKNKGIRKGTEILGDVLYEMFDISQSKTVSDW